MLFNTLDFAIFLPIVFILYWFVTKRNLKLQNLLILLASYVFYGWWDWKFLLLIFSSTIIDYIIGILLEKENQEKKRKLYLYTSIAVNIGLLGFFKYYNFFVDNFISAFSFFGSSIKPNTLNIILPVGISFYTFQTLSYTIDIYRKRLKPTKDLIAFSAFVSFFPQLVAGPIERAANLLPQFYKRRKFEYHKAVDGLRQILWGLFKKVVIADNCAEYVDQIFSNSGELNGSSLVIGLLFFSFQAYGDFSGYSDIAIGTSRLFGFNLMKNFSYPFFARDIAEFWRKWHISLMTWFRDYIYIPLGGSRVKKSRYIFNVFIVFLISGLWHGANWTYVLFGAIHGLYFMPLLLFKNNRANLDIIAENRVLPTFRELRLMIYTFALVNFSWILFRAEDLSHSISIFKKIFSLSFFQFPDFDGLKGSLIIFVMVSIFICIEWISRKDEYGIEKFGSNWKKPFRYGFYYIIILLILLYVGKEEQFIYFQF
jgi:D-alanyl-lipoteichoic acid acyltransferase DltB (MBOAT superfamily)